MLVKHEFAALGSHWWFEIGEGYYNDLFEDLEQMMHEFENKFSRFKSTSLIYKLNTEKSLNIEDEELFELLQFGFDLETKTKGLFSPLAGTYLDAAGYDAELSFQSKDRVAEIPTLIELTPTRIEISKHALVDFGGFGKGWLVDKISNYLINHGFAQFIVNAGGDIYCYGFAEPGELFYLENPELDGTYIGEIRLTTGAIASSSANRRRWQSTKAVEKMHNHIIDLKTGLSSNKVMASFVAASKCLYADVIATILLINPAFDPNQLFDEQIEYCLIDLEKRFHKTQSYPALLYTA